MTFAQIGRKLDRKFENFEDRFKTVDYQVGLLGGQSEITRAMFKNDKASAANSPIVPVPYHDTISSKILDPPSCFPRHVTKFWSLRQNTREAHRELFDLLKFYRAEGWERWGLSPRRLGDAEPDTTNSGDPDSDYDGPAEVKSSDRRPDYFRPIGQSRVNGRANPYVDPDHKSLYKALKANPGIALRVLATHIGLPFDKIEQAVTEAAEAHQNMDSRSAARHRPQASAEDAGPMKRRR